MVSKPADKAQESTSQNEDKVLVVVPTLGKRNDYLRLTLESIAAQTPCPYDIVIVYPLENKGTRKLAEEFGASSVADPVGMSAAVNAGVASAKPWHKYISWIGDDDLLTPGSLSAGVAALQANQKAVAALGYCDYIDANGKRLFTSRAGSIAPWLATWGPDLVPMPGLLMRLSALNMVGKFDEGNKWCMDLEMILRLRKHGKFVNTKRTQAAFRWHANSQTVTNRDRVLKEAQEVKRRNLSPTLRTIAPLWEGPVWLATLLAVRYVDSRAKAQH